MRAAEHEWRTTITAKGQATIPAEVRRLLDVRPGEKISFVVEKGQVRLRRPKSVVAETAGAFKGNDPAPSAAELREIAERAIAEDVAERMGK